MFVQKWPSTGGNWPSKHVLPWGRLWFDSRNIKQHWAHRIEAATNCAKKKKQARPLNITRLIWTSVVLEHFEVPRCTENATKDSQSDQSLSFIEWNNGAHDEHRTENLQEQICWDGDAPISPESIKGWRFAFIETELLKRAEEDATLLLNALKSYFDRRVWNGLQRFVILQGWERKTKTKFCKSFEQGIPARSSETQFASKRGTRATGGPDAILCLMTSDVWSVWSSVEACLPFFFKVGL
jgi:hypothetical protein